MSKIKINDFGQIGGAGCSMPPKYWFSVY